MPTSTQRGHPTALTDLGIEHADWNELGPAFIDTWGKPDGRFDPEHLTVYGKSGSGKTYFVAHALKQRVLRRSSHVVIVATKKTDRTLSAMGWPIVNTWPPGYGQRAVIYWARANGITKEARLRQRLKVKSLMNQLWVPGSNIIVYWDELPYVEIMLGLKPEIETYYREGRALGICNVAAMQRPAGVTRLSHSEAGWTVAFPPKDVDDRDRIAEVLGDRMRFRHALDLLDRRKHEFIIRHDRTGETYVSHLPKPGRRVAPARRRTGVHSAR